MKRDLLSFRRTQPTEEAPVASSVRNAIVEIFERRAIAGWVEVAPGAAPVRVGLYINDNEAAGTWALANGGRRVNGEVRQFRFALYDFWRFAKRSDQVTVRVDGNAIPIAGKGMYYRPRQDGVESLKALQRRRKQGYVFGQSGKIQLSKSLDTHWQAAVMGLYARVNAVLEGAFGYQAFLCYGTLLGAIREGGFIGHDLDFDCAYVSKHVEGADAAAELKDVAFELIEQGFNVVAKRTCLAVTDPESNGVKIDLFHLYYDGSGRVRFPFGVAGSSTLHRHEFGVMQDITLAGHPAKVPTSAELLLEHIYGTTWRTPNPGFNWRIDRTAGARDGIVDLEQVEEVYWANFYAHTSYDGGSTFCDFVVSRDDLPTAVLDIGCGDGRDSYAFAKAGRTVTGLDRSHIGLRHAKAKSEQLGYGASIDFVACDVNDTDRLRATIERARMADPGKPLLFYTRFFLHSIAEETQHAMMALLSEYSRPGDCFAAEFRTDMDEAMQKVHTKHFRRYQNGQAFAAALPERYGFDVLVQQEGKGLSPYKGEDPELFRVVARRAADMASVAWAGPGTTDGLV